MTDKRIGLAWPQQVTPRFRVVAVDGNWAWRDTNYQMARFARRKDLFNILYGTMPMWHIFGDTPFALDGLFGGPSPVGRLRWKRDQSHDAEQAVARRSGRP